MTIAGLEVRKSRCGVWSKTEDVKFCHFHRNNKNMPVAMFQEQNCLPPVQKAGETG